MQVQRTLWLEHECDVDINACVKYEKTRTRHLAAVHAVLDELRANGLCAYVWACKKHRDPLCSLAPCEGRRLDDRKWGFVMLHARVRRSGCTSRKAQYFLGANA